MLEAFSIRCEGLIVNNTVDWQQYFPTDPLAPEAGRSALRRAAISQSCFSIKSRKTKISQPASC